ncbi:GNAT family N-acetyltransferase [Nocardioides sp. GY 10113]|uniref:GNAT family N-acetyltransferase n=1 Tax=Nocardioides sp. GY 10113 TaxID=2569761 RepID=UPI0010A8577F|nr:GNAT family protein [Nocardioides sp. GY 10113]TIC87979.1 GNAT family N-acetyltransferase [Nocardioides sp. GY 10113]
MSHPITPPVGAPVPGWQPRPRPEPVTLAGVHVRVEPLTSARYSDLYAATCGDGDDDLWTYRPVDRPTSLPTLWMHLAGVLGSPTDVTFALVPTTGPAAGTAAGIASYLRVEPAHGQIEVGGILLSRVLQRTAAATEAIHLLMRHAFDDLGYRRFEWKCDSLNEPSRRAAARLGFAYEGRFRNHLVVKGRNRDTDWFSVTDAEWPAVRAAHERWLDPANFDDRGRQRAALSEATASIRP